MHTALTITSTPRLFCWQYITAGLLFFAAAFLIAFGIWGTDGRFGMASAQAESIPPQHSPAPMSPQELKAAIDNLAIALGGILHNQPTDAGRREIIKKALDTLTFQPGQEVYYTAWHGTEILHSPFMPDLTGEDFRNAKDIFGNPFVSELEGQAAFGGFLKVTLPLYGAESQTATEQCAYARLIPLSNWHLAAFMPVDDTPRITALRSQEQQKMQTGFLYSGFSLMGLAGILVAQSPFVRRPIRDS